MQDSSLFLPGNEVAMLSREATSMRGWFVRMRRRAVRRERQPDASRSRPQVSDRWARLYRSTWIDTATVCAALLITARFCLAENALRKDELSSQEVIIQADRVTADERVTDHVQLALAGDPWIDADHVTVTTHNGVVILEGVVADLAELHRIIRLCRKIPGARRVYTSGVEINAQLPDGG